MLFEATVMQQYDTVVSCVCNHYGVEMYCIYVSRRRQRFLLTCLFKNTRLLPGKFLSGYICYWSKDNNRSQESSCPRTRTTLKATQQGLGVDIILSYRSVRSQEVDRGSQPNTTVRPPNVFAYLVCGVNAYTYEQFKNYKSLESC